MKTSVKQIKRAIRQRRIRAKVSGTSVRPRLSIFKSNKYIYAQIIDDVLGKTLCASSGKKVNAKTKASQAEEVGKEIANLAKKQKISSVVFDRGGYIYTGRVKILAESARKAGLNF